MMHGTVSGGPRTLLLNVAAVARHQPSHAYAFRGHRGRVRWPARDGLGLAVAGAFNALLRMGLCPELTTPADVPRPATDDVLFVGATEQLRPDDAAAVRDWLDRGGRVVASGCSAAWQDFFPGCTFREGHDDRPYSGLAFLLDGHPPELVAPPRWTLLTMSAAAGVDLIGHVAVVHGERQAPARAAVSVVTDAPAIVRRGGFVYLNANVFGAFQAWLQGQEDLESWISWRHRLFWLDEMVAFFQRMLARAGIFRAAMAVRPVRELGETTVVLRHDLDHSRDTTYLQMEQAAGVPAVHAVLKDANTGFWRDTLSRAPAHESAFHYTTAATPRWRNARRARLGRPALS